MMEKLPSEYLSEALNGKKTYILGFLIIILTIAQTLGVIDATSFITIIGILLGVETIGFRALLQKKLEV